MSPSIDEIVTVVARHHGLTVADMKSHQKSVRLCGPRHLAVSMVRALTSKSNAQIAIYFGRYRGQVAKWMAVRYDAEAMREMWRKLRADRDPARPKLGRRPANGHAVEDIPYAGLK